MTAARNHLVVGTAGHIDHGKSALVEALTGTDPDRWEEEKRRGITIDLGFAHAQIEGVDVAFVDVPGHERFVHNMLAGAFGVDLLLLVVAADESVMPQTREHLAICDLLGLQRGIVVLTRCDLAEEGFVDLAREEVRETVRGTFLHDAPIVTVSSVTGEGLDDLRQAIVRAAGTFSQTSEGPWPRLPIDRVFAAKGFGTIVTGTLQGGAISIDDALVAMPGNLACRVRGIEVHGDSVSTVEAHHRVAINLHGVDRHRLRRGMALVPPGCGTSTVVFDAALSVLEDAPAQLEDGQRVRVHLGTSEVLARVRLPERRPLDPGSRGVVQLRLEQEISALPQDRFIVRRYSPLVTLAGGVLTDLAPIRWKRSDPHWVSRTEALSRAGWKERLEILCRESGIRGLALDDSLVEQGIPARWAESFAEEVNDGAGDFLVFAQSRLLSREGADALAAALHSALDRYHREHPLEEGMAKERLRKDLAPSWSVEAWREFLLEQASRGEIEESSDRIRRVGHRAKPEGADEAALAAWLERIEAAGLKAMSTEEIIAGDQQRRHLLHYAARRGEILALPGGTWLSRSAWRELLERLKSERREGRETLDVPRFKELFGLSRKYAIPLLERLDDGGITMRMGNERKIRDFEVMEAQDS